MHGSEGEWKCTIADWVEYDLESSPKRYQFNFEWQYSKGGWDPSVVFVDQRTGKPPPGLVKDEGYKTIKYYKRADYDELLSGRLQEGGRA